MSKSPIDEMLEKLHKLQRELESEIEQLLKEKQQVFRYTLEKGKVKFEQGIKALQKHHKINAWRYLVNARIGHILSAPFIYIVIIPFLLLDLFVSLYQQVCFRIYGIPLVKRTDYFIVDRQKLHYLNVIEKVNCVYCGYSNGLIEYVREIAARTEQYWCPIKHATRSPDPHRLVNNFVDFGDAEAYKERLETIQQEVVSINKSQDI